MGKVEIMMKYSKNSIKKSILCLGMACAMSGAAWADGGAGAGALELIFVMPPIPTVDQKQQEITIERTSLGDSGGMSDVITPYETFGKPGQYGLVCKSPRIIGAKTIYPCTVQTLLPSDTTEESYRVTVQPMMAGVAVGGQPIRCHRGIVRNASTLLMMIDESGATPTCTTES
jgi:hypothetical protein